jgi:hypothetical protein
LDGYEKKLIGKKLGWFLKNYENFGTIDPHKNVRTAQHLYGPSPSYTLWFTYV